MRALPEPGSDRAAQNEPQLAWTELFDAVLAGANQDPRPMRQLRSLLDENRALRAANTDLASLLQQPDGERGPAWASTWGWIATRLDLGRGRSATVSEKPPSWQDVHLQDTRRLARREEPRNLVITPGSGAALAAPELGWLRRNAALTHLLRSGQWQPVPASPPDCWAQRLATRADGITVASARQLLRLALDTAPQPAMAKLPQPPSIGEQEWAHQNRATLHGLAHGELRGIPATPSRAWVSASLREYGSPVVFHGFRWYLVLRW